MFKKSIIVSLLGVTSILPTTAQTISGDTLAASKIASKALKLINSGKESKISKGIALYEQAGSMGLPSACRFLAEHYMKSTPPNPSSSLHWLEILGDLNDSTAISRLVSAYSGELPEYGFSAGPNMEKLHEWSKPLAERGSLKGILAYASTSLELGDTTQAIAWHEKGAEAGVKECQAALANIYSQSGSNLMPSRAFEYAKAAAEQGDMDCKFLLGRMYLNGFGCQQDHEKALACYEECKAAGMEDCDLPIAVCKAQITGDITPETFQMFLAEAERGNSSAQFSLGQFYANGEGVEANLDKALEWYEKSAEQDYVPAYYPCAMVHFSGQATGCSRERGVHWLTKASDAGILEAPASLAIAYIEGEGVEKSVEKGVEILKNASDSGNPYTQALLSSLYLQGSGVPKDDHKGVLLLQQAALSGYAEAQVNLGVCYISGLGDLLTQDEKLCNDDLKTLNENTGGGLTNSMICGYWLEKASDQGHPIAKQNLSIMILSDEIPGDKPKAIQMLDEAASYNLPEAQFALGNIYLEGKNITKNEAKGIELIKKAADQGYDQAVYTLGLMYLGGNYVKKDIKKGIELLKKSADNGSAVSQYNIGLIYLQGGEGVSAQRSQGVSYLKKSAEQGFPAAMFYVAMCYLYGEGVTVNRIEGKRWMQKAAAQSDDPEVKKAAQDALKQI